MPKGKVEKTDGRMILAWRSREEGYSLEEVGEKFGVSGRTISKWVGEVNDDPELRLAANSEKRIVPQANNISKRHGGAPKPNGKPKAKKPKKDLEYVARLEDELAFMKWWNNGERSGYVERLLKLLAKG